MHVTPRIHRYAARIIYVVTNPFSGFYTTSFTITYLTFQR